MEAHIARKKPLNRWLTYDSTGGWAKNFAV